MKCKKLRIIIVFITILALLSIISNAQRQNETVMYFFWGDGCPHCAEEKPFLEELKNEYPGLIVKDYEIWHNKENAKLFADMTKAFGINPKGVPTTFLDDKVWVGFAKYMEKEIEAKVKYCSEFGCQDPIKKLDNSALTEISESKETLSPMKEVCIHVFVHGDCIQCDNILPYLEQMKNKFNFDLKVHNVQDDDNKLLYEKFKSIYGLDYGAYPIVFIGERFLIGENSIKENIENEIKSCQEKGCICPAEKVEGLMPYLPKPEDITPESDGEIVLPLFGKIDSSKFSLPMFTIILGALDSFNPCAFFVLFFLLSMLVYAQSRKRMLLIGLTFIFFSAFIYFLFMAAWLNIFLLIGQLMIITIIAGIIALIVALINIKDFFFFEKGISLVIPEKAKPKLFQKMRNLLKATSVPSMMIGTIVLAIAANSYELLCTAGFPMVFTRIMTLHKISTTGYYLYLILYNLIYIIPLLIIVMMFVITLGAKKLTEWQGQILKLISGLMMLCLGLILLIKPALLNNVFLSLSILLAALVTAGIIIYITKKIKRKKSERGKQNEQL